MMNGNSRHKNQNFLENSFNGYSNGVSRSSSDGYATIPTSSSITSSPSNGTSFSGLNYIEHRVTKMDTLAGVAIKYGVEVADIRRMNGLVTDLQMFALETLRIPRPGRHPPSPMMSNGSDMNGDHTPTPPRRQSQGDILDSFQSLNSKPPRRVSPAMSSLRGYYGLRTPPKKPPPVQGTETSAKGQHRKSRSLVSLQNSDENGDNSEADKSIRRRQKADSTDASLQPPEMGRGLLGKIGKNIAIRSASPIGDFFSDVFVSMRKSSSASNLQESDGSGSGTGLWTASKWSLKADVISMSSRRNKAALD